MRVAGITDKAIRLREEAGLAAPAYAARLNRLAALRESARVNAVQAAAVENAVAQRHFADVALEAFSRTTFDIQQYTGLGFGFSGMDTGRLNQILRYNWSGRMFSQRVWGNAGETARNLAEARRRGLRFAHGGFLRETTFRPLRRSSSSSKALRLCRIGTGNDVRGAK